MNDSTDLRELKVTIERILDEKKIHDLMVKYCIAVDTKNHNQLLTIFTDDALVEVPASGLKFGIKQYCNLLEQFKDSTRDRMHFVANEIVDIRASEAEARSYWHSTITYKDTPIVEGGWYQRRLKKTETGDWKHTYLKIIHLYRSPLSMVRPWHKVGYPDQDPTEIPESSWIQLVGQWI